MPPSNRQSEPLAAQSPTPITSNRMKAVRRRDTAEEIRLRRALYKMGLRYGVDSPITGIPRLRPDIVFAGPRVAVYVDGCFWHGCPIHGTRPKSNSAWWQKKIAENVARDRRHNERLAIEGWLVLRFWGHEDMELAAKLVHEAVASRR